MVAPTVAFDGSRINTADSITGWSAGGVDADSKIQGTGCIGTKVSAATQQFIYTDASMQNVSVDERHFYVWLNCLTPTLDTKANGGLRAIIGNDATNYGEHFVAGQDLDYPGGWKKFAVSPRRTPDVQVGVINLTAIDTWGGTIKNVGSIMGNFSNALIDAIDLGIGLRLTNGDATTPGTFQSFLTFDDANKYGIIRAQSGVYFVQGKLLVGDGVVASLLQETSRVVVFENALVDPTFYEIRAAALGTIRLGTYVNGVSQNGCTITAASGFQWFLNAGSGLGTFEAYACSFTRARAVALNASCIIRDTTFSACGTISSSGDGATIADSIITGSTATSAMVVSSPTQMSRLSNLQFLGNNRAINITSPGTYVLNNIQFSGNAYDIHNTSGGHVVIQVSGGDSPSVLNDGAGTSAVQNVVNHTLTGLVDGSEVRYYRASDDAELFSVESVAGGSTTYSFNHTGDVDVYIHIHHVEYVFIRLELTLTGEDQTIPIQQRRDRVYSNPS